jgi:hypothetical protein
VVATAGAVAEGEVSEGGAILHALGEQEVFQAEEIPATPQAVDKIIGAGSGRPDALVLVGVPRALQTAAAAEAIREFIMDGGFVLVYGSRGLGTASGPESPDLARLLPASSELTVFTVERGGVIPAEHPAATNIAWQNHPAAELLVTDGRAGAEMLGEAGGKAVAWLRQEGEGAVAWYPASETAAADPDMLSWFVRGRPLAEAGEGNHGNSLLTRMLAYGCREKLRVDEVNMRGIWLVALSLMVCVVGITNAMLMSVTERFREIGTMKCLGALDKFVVKLFLIESSLQGVAGSLAGAAIGFMLAFLRALFTFRVQDLQTGESYWLAVTFFPFGPLVVFFFIALTVGILLSVVAAIYPAIRAAHMEPVQAMRVEA